jgi:outer membrane receptor protein involved in Fe transport
MNHKSLFALTAIAAAVAASLPSARAADEGLAEVVVTATKREQTLQDVPVAVTVTSADTLQKAEIHDILDLQSVVPSLHVTQLQTSTQTNFLIRGFGNGANNPGIESSVGVFIDGVYRSRSASQIGDLVNAERVEVLRGPQSTLFGQNASAGVISVTTKKPSFTPTGMVELGAGDYAWKSAKGYYSAGLSENVAFSVNAGANSRDGYFTNLATGSHINDRNRVDVGAQLLLNATDNLSVRFIGDLERIDEKCCGVVNLLNGPTGAVIKGIGGNLYTGPYADRKVYMNADPTNVVRNSGLSMHVDWKLGATKITSITALRSQQATFNYDSDFTSADLVPKNLNDQNIHTFTQELRASFDNGGPVSGLVGAYYFKESVGYDNSIAYGTGMRTYASALVGGAGGLAAGAATLGGLETSLGLPAGTFFKAGTGLTTNADQDNDAYTLFGQMDWKLAPKLTLTGGVAYTKSDKTVSLGSSSTDTFAGLNFVQIGFAGAFKSITGLDATPSNIAAVLGNPATAPYAKLADQISVTPCPTTTLPACNTALGLYPLQFLTPVSPYTGGKSGDSKATYTLRLAYELTDNVRVYGGVSTGFKATSWNLSRDSKPFPPATGDKSPLGFYANPYYGRYGSRYAGPEESTVVELGLKGKWPTVALNVALFDQEIKGFQSNTFTGTGFTLSNAGKQSTKGAEAELVWAPVRALELSLAATYMDPLYDSYKGAEGPSGPMDMSGMRPAGISSFSSSTAITYRWEAGNWNAFVRGDYQYESKVQVVDNVSGQYASRTVNQLNASIGANRWGWDFMLWGRNLTDEAYLLSAFPSVAQSGSLSGYVSAPRMWGITLRKSF